MFDELRLHRLEAACLPHNEPSKAVLGKAGFHEEGLARQYLRINGQWADHLLFALLRADYDAILRAPADAQPDARHDHPGLRGLLRKNAPDARTRDLLVSLAGHLHSFVRENKLTQAEWTAAIDALTRATQFTDDKRNEYILFSDLLGVSSLVDMVNAQTKGTPSSVLGPFFIENTPELPNGGDLWHGQVGEPLVVSGKIVDQKGAPAAGTVLALWQNAGNGLYAQQDPQQNPTNYHGRLTVAPTAPSPSRRCGRSPTRCRTTARPATCCACSAAMRGGRRICT